MTAALRKLASSTRVGGAMARVASALVARPRDAGPAEAAEVQQVRVAYTLPCWEGRPV